MMFRVFVFEKFKVLLLVKVVVLLFLFRFVDWLVMVSVG